MNIFYFLLVVVVVGSAFGQTQSPYGDFSMKSKTELQAFVADPNCSCVNLVYVFHVSDTLDDTFRIQLDLLRYLVGSLKCIGLLKLRNVAVLNIASSTGRTVALNFGNKMNSVAQLVRRVRRRTERRRQNSAIRRIFTWLVNRAKFIRRSSCITKVVLVSDFKGLCFESGSIACRVIRGLYAQVDKSSKVDICAVVIKSDHGPLDNRGIAGDRFDQLKVFKSYYKDGSGTVTHNTELFNEVLFNCSLYGCVFSPAPTAAASCDEFSDPANYCQQCMERRNNLDYYPDLCNCSNYYHCFFNGTGYIGILRPCPPGSKFSDLANHCLPTPFNCVADDPCHSNATVIADGYWQFPDECGIWYQCANYYSVKHCCPPFQRFNISWRDCMGDANCIHHNEECGQPGITIPMFSPIIFDTNKCNDTQYNVIRQVNPASASSYLVIVEGYDAPIVIECPQTTAFNLNSCKCDIFAPPRSFAIPDTCFLNITCDNNPIMDSSINNNFIDNAGSPSATPQVNDADAASVCRFNGPGGTGWVEVPHFQGKDLRFALTACWWFRWDDCGDQTDNNRFVIFSNRGENSLNPAIGNVDSSVLVKTVAGIPPFDTEIEVTIRTTSQNSFTATSDPITCGVWNHICFTFSPAGIQIYVNGQTSGSLITTDGNPIFWMTHCPLTIGQDRVEYNGRVLDGLLDEILWCSKVFSSAEITDLYQSQVGDYNI